MKTKFIAAIIAALFPLGAIAQTSGSELGAGAGLAGQQGTAETEAGVRASGQDRSGASSLQRQNEGMRSSPSASADVRSEPRSGFMSRFHARADHRNFNFGRDSYAADGIRDEGVAIGLQKNEG
ncbi:MAG TPA: hypothetical protein VFC14_08565 [Burkholderiales bacterium]|jgi:hypothetical protein|nr:hypothetical protein [Burkholderiales bacterium]